MDEGGLAFARAGSHKHDQGQDGMTLLDYFAAYALAKVTVSPVPASLINEEIEKAMARRIALCAYDLAEAMVEEKRKREKASRSRLDA